ncbi:unnamed protein product [Rhizophagus irregularis]|nr:unnamed protein product [Rhizophagus irregularis]
MFSFQRFPCRNILSSFRLSDVWKFTFLFRRPKNVLKFGIFFFGIFLFFLDDFLDLFGRVSLFGFLTQDFGGSSAFQQGDFDVSFSLEKEISVFNFFSTWDFDGRSLKGTLRIPSDQLYD